MGKRHIYRLESADVLNICDRVRTGWERSRALSADVVAAERERAIERNDGCFCAFLMGLGMRRRDQ